MVSESKPSKRLTALLALALLLLTGAVYAPALENDFVNYDDPKYVTANPAVTAGVSARGVRWAFDNHQTGNWHPLTWMTHMLVCELSGLEPAAHHLVNAVLHGLCAVALLLALRAMGLNPWPSALVAALFCVHPLRVESVAWVAELKDVLSGLCFMLALLAYARHARAPSVARHTLVSLALVLGLMAKPMLVTLPFVLLLLDRWPLERWGRTSARSLLLEKLPWIALAGVAAWVALVHQREVGATRSGESIALAARAANAFAAYGTYVTQSLWPHGLAVFHPHPAIATPDAAAWDAGAGVWAAVVLLASLGALVALRRKAPWVGVGWLWFVGMLVPVIGIVQVGGQAWAERYAYLPTIGLYLALAFTLEQLVRGRAALRNGSIALALLALALLAFVARGQVRVWRNSETLFRHALAVTERNHVAHFGLGLAHEEAGRLAQAEEQYRLSVAIDPRSDRAHNNLGVVLLKTGRLSQARAMLAQALAIEPRSATALNNLGTLSAREGNLASARELFERAVQSQPENAQGHRNLGGVLERSGDLDGAYAAFTEAQRLAPFDLRGHEDLGRVAQQRGDAQAAIEHYTKALTLDPPPLGAANNLAWIRATHPDPALRDGEQARRWARHCVSATGEKDARMLNTLAAASAEAGDFEAAVRWQERAIGLAPAAQRQPLTRRLELYRSRQPLRERP